MKNPHDKNEYQKVDDGVSGEIKAEATAENPPEAKKKDKKSKLSGAYYYVEKEDQTLKDMAFARTVLCVIGFMLQIVVLMLPQGGLEYITYNMPSLAYAYVWAVFLLVGVSVWLFVMFKLRYKIVKRIPVEYAPKHGFKRRAYFGSELYIAINAVVFVFELCFVCIHYDGIGLISMFLTLLGTGCAVGSRVVTQQTLKSAVVVAASEQE